MNRYLIAALYVMAGCAVTIPLKAQGCGESLRGERCRLIITNTVKVVSVYLEEEEEEQVFCSGLPPDYFQEMPFDSYRYHASSKLFRCRQPCTSLFYVSSGYYQKSFAFFVKYPG